MIEKITTFNYAKFKEHDLAAEIINWIENVMDFVKFGVTDHVHCMRQLYQPPEADEEKVRKDFISEVETQ